MSDLPPTEKPKWVEDAERGFAEHDRLAEQQRRSAMQPQQEIRQMTIEDLKRQMAETPRQRRDRESRESKERISNLFGREPQPAWPHGSPVGGAMKLQLPTVAELLAKDLIYKWERFEQDRSERTVSFAMGMHGFDSPEREQLDAMNRAKYAEFQHSILAACQMAIAQQDRLIAHYQQLEMERSMTSAAFSRESIDMLRVMGRDCHCGSPTQFDQINLKWICLGCRKQLADCECQKRAL